MKYLKQTIESANKIGREVFAACGMHQNEVFTGAEIASLHALFATPGIGANLKELVTQVSCEIPEVLELRKYINSKRIFLAGDNYISAPRSSYLDGSSLDALNWKLVKLALSWKEVCDNYGDERVARLSKFHNETKSLKVDISRILFSKEFKKMINFTFKGITGVACPGGNLELDEISLPNWLAKARGIKVGDYCLVLRDPIQHLFILCRVKSINDDAIRINSDTINLLDGDFDGDKLQVVALNDIVKEYGRLYPTHDLTAFATNLFTQAMELLPSKLIAKYGTDKGIEITEYSVKTTCTLDLVKSSKKSERFATNPNISIKDSVLDTVLNALGVNSGTGTAGSFCNWISEVSRNAGLDVAEARELANKFQRLALDSKHTTGAGGYKSLVWYKVATYRNSVKANASVESIISDLTAIMNEEDLSFINSPASFDLDSLIF